MFSYKTSIGVFTEHEFIKRCDKKSFPDGLQVSGWLDLRGNRFIKALPKGLKVSEFLNLRECTSLTALPEGLHVGDWLDLRYCISLTALPEGLQVGSTLFVNPGIIERYPFRDIPKILHLPFPESINKVLQERLTHGS